MSKHVFSYAYKFESEQKNLVDYDKKNESRFAYI